MALSDTNRSKTGINVLDYTQCEEDPMQLMEEFHSLYSEKVTKIEEKFRNCPEAKVKVLEEWVTDLTEQNRVLMKTVSDLENDAQERVKQIDCLKDEAKESLNQDDLQQNATAEKCAQYESTLCEYRKLLEENECSLKKACADISKLQEELCENKKECCRIRRENECLKGLQKELEILKLDLQEKDYLICDLEQKNLEFLEMNKNKSEAVSEKESNTSPDNTQSSLLEEFKKLRNLSENDIKIINNQKVQIEELTSKNCELQKMLKCKEEELNTFLCKENCYKNEICHLKNEADSFQNRSDETKEQMKFLVEVLQKKECELQKRLEDEENLKSEMCRIGEVFKKREEQMKDAYQNVTSQLRARNEEILRLSNGFARGGVKQQQVESIEKDNEVEKLKVKLKDVQIVLTGEIADKHDEIRRLKDDIKELEEKLRQSEKQTHYRDEMIKEMRKEVKLGRAKLHQVTPRGCHQQMTINIVKSSKEKKKSKATNLSPRQIEFSGRLMDKHQSMTF